MKEAHIESTKDIFQVCCAAFEDFPKISSFIHYNDVFMFFEGPIEEVVVKFQNEAKASYKNLKEIRQFCQEKMSNAERKADHVAFNIEPRFPIFGQWKTDWNQGYQMPTEHHLF